MSLGRKFRSDSQRRSWTEVLLASSALLALLVARNALPDFPKVPSAQSAASAVSHHDQRPRFDHGPQWSAPADRFLPRPPVAESSHLAPRPQRFLALQTKGFHYNRPPPIG